MRNLFVLAVAGMALTACAQQYEANACFVSTVKEASSGNFSHWALPGLVGGTHMKAGQYLNYKCEIVG